MDIFDFFLSTPVNAQDQSFCLVLLNPSDPLANEIEKGAMERAEHLGTRVVSHFAKHDGDVESQVAAIEKCVAEGVQGILLQPTDLARLADPAQMAIDEGIPVAAVSVPISSSHADVGAIQDDWAQLELPRLLEATTGITSPTVAVYSGDLSKLPPEALEPDTDVLISTGSTNWQDFEPLHGSGGQRVFVTGPGCDVVNAVERGQVAGALLTRPRAMGYKAMETLLNGGNPRATLGIPPLIVGEMGISPGEAMADCAQMQSVFQAPDLVWSGSVTSNDDCPTCPPSGACAQEILMARAACCPPSGACGQ